jgi:hypothetical protein
MRYYLLYSLPTVFTEAEPGPVKSVGVLLLVTAARFYVLPVYYFAYAALQQHTLILHRSESVTGHIKYYGINTGVLGSTRTVRTLTVPAHPGHSSSSTASGQVNFHYYYYH